MPEDADLDHDLYKGPPSRTPVVDRQLSWYHPAVVIDRVFYWTVDLPVTTFREWMMRKHEKNRYYYYHRKFRRVPDVTECMEDDFLCLFEAESQWRRDKKVDQEIVKMMNERLGACRVREGESSIQNCAKHLAQFIAVSKAFADRYGDLGYHGSARQCLMKQKQRMIAERRAKAKNP
uniref:NADH dehydrogenase [ubiquinone] 1 beta subcomplex subunit 10 n=1 Tax=Pelusios castaneus TaxID=367368 RepID=A0A8C8S9K9_9SAUR